MSSDEDKRMAELNKQYGAWLNGVPPVKPNFEIDSVLGRAYIELDAVQQDAVLRNVTTFVEWVDGCNTSPNERHTAIAWAYSKLEVDQEAMRNNGSQYFNDPDF